MVTVVVVVVVVVSVVLAAWYIVSYNRFVTQRLRIDDSWAVIELELQRRHDLIPRLMEPARAAAAHERAAFDRLADLRTQAMSLGSSNEVRHELAALEQQIENLLHDVFAVAEEMPTLRSSANFVSLQRELSITEDRVAAARRFYNMRVRDLNERIAAFPSLLVARRHGITPATYFEA